MFKNKYIGYFIFMFFPMFAVSVLLNLSYSLNAHDYIQINWLIAVLLAVVLAAFLTWMHKRKDKEKKSE
jgi:uncharacterized membrane protein YdjX (TVP38/TMEM64 family)